MTPVISVSEQEAPRFCGSCGAVLGEGALVCGGCKTLVYAADLESLLLRARAASSVGNREGADEAWRQALRLLPPDSAQYKTISDHLAAPKPDSAPPGDAPKTIEGKLADHPGQSGWRKLTGSLGILGAILWKFKFYALYILGKGKFLLFGLSKLSTLLTMFASFGLYWSWYGWAFAGGFVLSIYVHEMGHIYQLRQFGIKSTAPLFLPGFGAVVFLREKLATPGQDARVGLAGPIWGVGAAIFCYVMAALSQNKIWLALAQAGALINLFNLIPVWQLDGGRGFHALTKVQRIRFAVLAAVLWGVLRVPMFFLILLGCGYRLLFAKDPAKELDLQIEIEFAGLMIVLGLLTALPVVR